MEDQPAARLASLFLEHRSGDDVARARDSFSMNGIISAFCCIIGRVSNFSKCVRTRSEVSAAWCDAPHHFAGQRFFSAASQAAMAFVSASRSICFSRVIDKEWRALAKRSG